jgi:iron complex transport system ATP-binding protein
LQNTILHTENLTTGYSRKGTYNPVCSKLNLSVFPGELIAVIGPNGCGKSTLLRTLSGLQKPLSGNIYINGENILSKSVKEKAKIISLVLTEPVKIGGVSVYDLISMGRFPHTTWPGNLTETDKEKIDKAIRLIRLERYESRLVSELSDGERQRVMIAKALVQDTPVILLDEPTAHLDLNNRIEIISLLRSISKETSKSIILSTHELELVLNLTDRIWLMSKEFGLFDKTPTAIKENNILDKVFNSRLFRFNHEGRIEFS